MNSVVLTDAVQSAVMVAAFLAVPFVLGSHWGYIWQFAPAGCISLSFVANVTGINNEPPATCPAAGDGCLPSGCLADVRPEFYDYPSRQESTNMGFFLLNMVAA